MSFIITYKHSGTKRLAKPKLAGIEREACTSLPPFPAQRAVKRQKRARNRETTSSLISQYRARMTNNGFAGFRC